MTLIYPCSGAEVYAAGNGLHGLYSAPNSWFWLVVWFV